MILPHLNKTINFRQDFHGFDVCVCVWLCVCAQVRWVRWPLAQDKKLDPRKGEVVLALRHVGNRVLSLRQMMFVKKSLVASLRQRNFPPNNKFFIWDCSTKLAQETLNYLKDPDVESGVTVGHT